MSIDTTLSLEVHQPPFPRLVALIAWKRFVPLGLGLLGFYLALVFVLFPLAYRASALGKLSVSPLLTQEMRIAALDELESRELGQFHSRLKKGLTKIGCSTVLEFMRQPGPAACVLPDLSLDVVDKLGADPAWKTQSAHGFNPFTGQREHLVLLVKEH
jgi:hypothetical protein